ncbi:MAG TPA: sensor histidine kinase [Chroococcales cyanobacterium]
MKNSIRYQLLLWLLVPLLTVAVLSLVAAYVMGFSLSRDIYDTQLLDSADSVVARIRVKNKRVSVDLPPAAIAVLRQNFQDEFYYQIFNPAGEFLTGDKSLPPLNIRDGQVIGEFHERGHATIDTNETMIMLMPPIFHTIELGNHHLRAVILKVPVPEYPDGCLFVQAAETRRTRAKLAARLTTTIFIIELLLISAAAISIWFGVKRGLMPLTRIERAVKNRSAADFSPLEVDEPVEVASLINALNRLLKQLGDDVEMQNRFIANAAHQLRTPLAVLGSYCNLAQKTVPQNNDEAQDALRELNAAIARMSHMVRRLLSLARSEPQVAQSKVAGKVDLNAVASTATAAQAPEAIRKKLEVEFRAAPQPAYVLGDQERLEELFGNLIENAIIYTPPRGEIVVEVKNASDDRADSQAPMVMVSDTGPGIPEAERGRIFERFYRITGTEQPGTGLGLAIVREIATSHKATITVQAGLNGTGTCVCVTFPPYTSDAKPPAAELGQSDSGKRSASASV